ncbi:frequency clock protein [Diplocarpon rosae]|nr:frequency clock protein [Diplocarpon rosae]
MFASAEARQPPASPQRSHPRRPPAHLSVSLRHDDPPTSAEPAGAPPGVGRVLTESATMKQPSENSNDLGDCAQKWFDQNNNRPGKGLGFLGLEDADEPPYFLPHNSSSSSGASPGKWRPHLCQAESHLQHPQSAVHSSSAGDYRSVIDDLTIENRKLKQQLRQLMKSRNAPLEEDRLFEVRIHGEIPPRKRRELEDVLGSFASGIHEAAEEEMPGSRAAPGEYKAADGAQKVAAKHSTSSSTSNSRPLDSAYASMSNSGGTSSTAYHAGPPRRNGGSQTGGKEPTIQSGKPGMPPGHSTATENYVSDASDEASPNDSSDDTSPSQRPTRPLDLDPDRAQVPADNVDYIRHLGLSTPNFNSENSSDSDVGADSEGWIYLNLLESDGVEQQPMKKRRRLDAKKPSPALPKNPDPSSHLHNPAAAFQYQPLFRHGKLSPQASSDTSESFFDYSPRNEDSLEAGSAHPRTWKDNPTQKSSKDTHDAEILVYYHGAQFCTDLSGDRGRTATPLHVSATDKDGYFNGEQGRLHASTSDEAPSISRTNSGSTLPFRPFKDYAKGAENPELGSPRLSAPEPLHEESGGGFRLDPFTSRAQRPTQLQSFESSGLGGTRPADHFMVRVETRRTKVNGHTPVKPPNFPTSSPGRQKLAQSVPGSSFRFVTRPNPARGTDHVTSHPRPTPPSTVRTEVTSTHFQQLQPSELPAPLGYHATYSSSDADSDNNSTSSEASRPWCGRLLAQRSLASPAERSAPSAPGGGGDEAEDSDDEQEEDDDGSSIDMLAEARTLNPALVAAQEQEFDMLAENELGTDVATINDSVNEDGTGTPDL